MEIISNIIYYIVPFIILLGILVFVHEFGHFIVARMLGVKVVAFSIGFGKELWSRTDKKGTEWKLSAIPLGGYCQFLGDGDASSSTTDSALENLSETDKSQAFATQSTWKKILIVVAGPLFNYALAVLLFIALFLTDGRVEVPSYVGEVIPDSAAEAAGIQPGDRVVSLNGNPTPNFRALIKETDLAVSNQVAVEIERRGKVTISAKEMEVSVCGEKRREKVIGLISPAPEKDDQGDVLPVLPVVGDIIPDSPAQKAGLEKGDIIETINDMSPATFTELKQYIASHTNEDYEITYRRNIVYEVNLKETVQEEVAGGTKRRMLGIISSTDHFSTEKLDWDEAIKAGFKETYDITELTLRGVWQIITGRRGGKDIGGIIRIAELSGDASKKGGLSGFIYFMALISVNLGLINLFPIPVLDGGNLVIYLIEMVIRRELKPKVKDYIFKFGLGILFAIMVLATWNDIVHLIGRWFH